MESIYLWVKENSGRMGRLSDKLFNWMCAFFLIFLLNKRLSPAEFGAVVSVIGFLLGLAFLVLDYVIMRAKKLGPKCYLCGGSTKWSLFFDQDVGVSRQTYKCQNRECGNRTLIKG